jgi:hypothetical protein
MVALAGFSLTDLQTSMQLGVTPDMFSIAPIFLFAFGILFYLAVMICMLPLMTVFRACVYIKFNEVEGKILKGN